ncbi:MAG: hypothetical protein NT091_01640 [Candidatus Falkowbacteria bacterium]|nr:hypothetical protein [Candidatus Falkowbacteria bacterium]
MKIYKIIILFFSLFIFSGCAVQFQGTSTNDEGGVFKSINSGDSWVNSSLVPTISGKPQSIARLNVNFLALDPSDPKAMYFGSTDSGLFYTYTSTTAWLFSSGMGNATPNALAIDSKAKCSLFSSINNNLYKSSDCTRNWSPIYHDDNAKAVINSIIISSYNSNNVYVGTSNGNLIASDDAGASWRLLNHFDASIERIIPSPQDSRIMLALIKGKGLYKTIDSGKNWIDLNEKLKSLNKTLDIRDVVLSQKTPGLIIVAIKGSLYRSDNYGDTWLKTNLLTSDESATINSVALGNQNTDLIYYTTNTTFYRSEDGGVKWSAKKLPTSRAGWRLIINPEDDKIIYLGVRSIK